MHENKEAEENNLYHIEPLNYNTSDVSIHQVFLRHVETYI